MNHGGDLFEFIETYSKARQEGTRYVIDGLCISACTLITGEVPQDRVCVTPFAKLAFHAAFTMDMQGTREFSPDGTAFLWAIYPEKVRELLRKHGWSGPSTDQTTLIWIEGEELLSLFRPCEATS
jgi:hypothetical protein